MIETDVCIVGAGPAGTATSLMLSKLKIKHVLIDKATFPRDKTCGDGLILYAYKALQTIDETLFANFLNNPKFLHATDLKLHINNEHYLKFTKPNNFPSVISYAKRIDFDAFLVEHINSEYTTTFFGNEVKKVHNHPDFVHLVLKDKTEIRAKLVVGADGVQSIISKKLGAFKIDAKNQSTFISTYFENVKNLAPNNEGEVRIIYGKTTLLFYVFTVGENIVNVSLGGNSQEILRYNINLIDEIGLLFANHSILKETFKNAKQLERWRGWVIPNSFHHQKCYGERFLLVGDAAGLANAFYKEGVGTGMMSGIFCAHQIKKCLEEHNFSEGFLKSYQQTLKQEFGKLLRFSEYSIKLTRKRKLFGVLTKVFKPYFERKVPQFIASRLQK